MERKCIKNLIEWKNSRKRKPLVLMGARQVGKTWLLTELTKCLGGYETVCLDDDDLRQRWISLRKQVVEIALCQNYLKPKPLRGR